MKLKLIFTLILMLLMIETASAVGYHWISNSTIVSGATSLSQPTVGYIDGVYYLIDGTSGYKWNGSGWESNITIVSGLSSPPPTTSFYNTMYVKDSLWTLVSLAQYDGFTSYPDYGYTWNGSGWDSNNTIKAGLSDIVGSCCQYRPSSSFSAINYGGVLNGILGRSYIIPATGYYYAFNYGTSFINNNWVSNTTLHNGFLPEGYPDGIYSTTGFSTPRTAMLVYNNTMYIVMGYTGGITTPYGYIWNNITSNWDSSSSMSAGLSGKTHFTSFEMNGIPRLISCASGVCSGYDLLNNTLPTTPNMSAPINNSVQQSHNVNITWNQSTDTNSDTITYQWQVSTQSNFSTLSYSGTTSNNYTEAVIGTNGSYWTRVRSYDTIDYSNWSNSIYFTAYVITRYVNTTGWWSDINPFNLSSTPITHAVSNSSIGDTVYVYNGTYTETPTITSTMDYLTLQGESSNLVNLSGGFTINAGADYVNISGFNSTGSSGGIILYGDYANISYNKFKNVGGYPSLYVNGNYNDFINNTIVGSDYGVVDGAESGGNYNEYINNTISGCDIGVAVYGGSYGTYNGGSIDNSITYDYYCFGGCGSVDNYEYLSGYNNNGEYFKNTNLSGYTRKIYMESLGMILNMSDNGITIMMSRHAAGYSTPYDFTRTFYNMTTTNVTFKDSGTHGRGYRLYGLQPDSYYDFYKDGIYQSILTTDVNGNLLYFSNIDVSDAIIKITLKYLDAPELTNVINETCGAHFCVIAFDVDQPDALTQVQYGLAEFLGDNTTNQTTGMSRSDNLTNLINNTKYYYSVFAWNVTNPSYWSNSSIYNFTTLEDYEAPPEYPITAKVAAQTAFDSVNQSNSSLLPTILKVFSISLLIFAFGIIFIQLRTEQPNSTIIFIGIMTTIIGFAMLLLGNYLLYAIMEWSGH